MLNKNKLIIVVATIAIVGSITAYATYTAIQNDRADAREDSSMAISEVNSKSESIDTMQIDAAVSAGIKQIEEADSKAIGQIQSTASTHDSKTTNTSSGTPNTSILPRTVKINVTSESVIGKIYFTSATVNRDEKHVSVVFAYTLESDRRLYPKDANGTDNNNNPLSMLNFGATPKGRFESGRPFLYEDTIGVYGALRDASDLSTVTLTYAFEGYDPVTITMDIPME